MTIHKSKKKRNKFINFSQTKLFKDNCFLILFKEILFNRKNKKPKQKLPINKITSDFWHDMPSVKPRGIWFGHSALLIELEGKRYLCDPMLSKFATPIPPFGPKRYSEIPLNVAEIDNLDAIILSHNHYDHLDRKTVKKLANKTKRFIVPLKLKKKLVSWGVEREKIVELDWGDKFSNDNVDIIATPARHYSGRTIFDRNKSLWCSYVLKSKNYRIFFSGDMGDSQDFSLIGDIFGPFDITFIESGSYNEAWSDVHLNPEKAVQGAIDLKSKKMIPIHWGAFVLAFHSWFDPVERVIQKAVEKNLNFYIPKLGEVINIESKGVNNYWWRKFK